MRFSVKNESCTIFTQLSKKYKQKERVTKMKKLLALLLAVAIMAGVCCFEVSAVPDPDYMPEPTETYTAANDKIHEFNYCYTNAQDDDELIVRVSFNPQGNVEEEIYQVIYERTGWTYDDLLEYSYRDFVNFEGEDISESEKLEIKEKINAYVTMEDELYKQYEEKYAKQFIYSTGLNFEYVSSNAIKYRGEPVAIGYACVHMCLTKSEINQVYQMDDVTKITCFRRKDGTTPAQPEYPDKIDLREYNVNKQEFLAAADDKLMIADIDLVGEDYDLFFEEMGIAPESFGKAVIYNDMYALNYGKNIKICLTKAEIYKAAELDCVDNIGVSIDPDGWNMLHCTKGDVNGDRSLDISDAVEIQKFAVDKNEFSEKQEELGDFNTDGKCDTIDSAAIQRALVAE